MQMLDGIQALEIYSDQICCIFRYSLASSEYHAHAIAIVTCTREAAMRPAIIHFNIFIHRHTDI